ncbi:hypothetical protein BBJ66_18760 [Rhizobium sp. RSm-3]|nr:hypothetical protein BBJ66_18760 [Rhizobium sp. RSm-3]
MQSKIANIVPGRCKRNNVTGGNTTFGCTGGVSCILNSIVYFTRRSINSHVFSARAVFLKWVYNFVDVHAVKYLKNKSILQRFRILGGLYWLVNHLRMMTDL